MPVGGTAFYGQNQSPRITTNYLNQLGRNGDPAPGVPVSTAQVSGSIVQPYQGMIGGRLTLTNPWASELADPAVGPLYGGLYQYVQYDPQAAAPPARGQILYWANEQNYIVTLTAGTNKIAGIAINPDTPGNWDFIQVAGIAMVLFGGAVLVNGMAAAGTGPTSNQAVTAAAVTAAFLGTAVLVAGATGVVSPLELNLTVGPNF